MMSGTSLDGVDIAWCEFTGDDQHPSYSIHAAETIPYSAIWKKKLAAAHLLNGEALTNLDAQYGRYLGQLAFGFIKNHKCRPDFIASHGHTVFHRPEQGFTLQIGNGAHLAAASGERAICDFRSLDVALGGQGAPLVPIGDRMLFGGFGYCLNLGGFANISSEQENRRMAYDICPANMALNHFAAKMNMDFDKDGLTAEKGHLNPKLLGQLNNLEFYHRHHPKSLGREWFESEFLTIVDKFEIDIPDILHTLVEHIAVQTGKAIRPKSGGRMLITGGGALNYFLVSRIRFHAGVEVIVPDDKLVHFKEALIFALLGWLRLQGRNNCLASVTGAKHDNCGGIIFENK